jgi:hypothetical protein
MASRFNMSKAPEKAEEPKPILIPVKSSTLDAIGYDREKEELTIAFKGGSQYLYTKVPAKTFDTLMTPPEGSSHGKFFHSNIKGKFDFVKIKQGIKKEKKAGAINDNNNNSI